MGIVESRHDMDLKSEGDLHYGVVHFGWRKTPEWSGNLKVNMAVWEDEAQENQPSLFLVEISVLLLVF